MAGKRRGNSQLYGIIALVAVVVVFVWAMVQVLNQNKVTTRSEAAINDYSNQNSQINPSGGGCNAKCDPASDVGCAEGLTCVDTALKGNPPDYRCRLDSNPSSIGCCWAPPVDNERRIPKDCPRGMELRPGGCFPIAGTPEPTIGLCDRCRVRGLCCDGTSCLPCPPKDPTMGPTPR